MSNSANQKPKNLIIHRFSQYGLTFSLSAGLLALGVYLGIAWFILPPEAFWSPDEGAKLLQLHNLRLEDGRPAYDVEYTGRHLDPHLQFGTDGLLEVSDNRLYLQRFPLFPLLTLPFFHGFGFFGLYLIPALSGAVITMLTLQMLPPPDGRVMWALIAFGSPVLVYAAMFWEHTLVTGLCLGAAWLSFKVGPIGRAASPRRIFGWVMVGLMLAVSTYIRTETVLFALAWLAAYSLLAQNGRWGVIWAGICLGVMLLLYVPLHQAMFGQTEKILHRSFLVGFHPLNYLERAGWQVIPDFLIGAPEDGAIASGGWGWVWAIAALAAIGAGLAPESRLTHTLMLIGLGLSAIVAANFLFTGTMYRSAHGLLFTTPWVTLGLCRAREVWQRGHRPGQIIVLSTLVGLLAYILAIMLIRAPLWGPHGALEWGARYALPFYPLLAILAAWDLKAKWQDISSLVIIGALVFSGIGFQIRGVWTIQRDKQINARINQIMANVPSPYVVSDLWWLPLNAAPLYRQKTVFFARPEKLAAWVDLAAAGRVQQFLLVTLNSALLQEANQRLDLNQLTLLEFYKLENLLIFHVAIEGR